MTDPTRHDDVNLTPHAQATLDDLPDGTMTIDLPDPAAQLERLQAVELRPGDLIIGTLPAGCTSALTAAVGHDLARRFPDHPTLLLPAGVGFHVTRPAAALTGSVQLPPGWKFHGYLEQLWPPVVDSDEAIAQLKARGLPTTTSDGQHLSGDDAIEVLRFADTLRTVYAQAAADARDPHRPPGYVTATGPDDANELYLPAEGAAPVCGLRYRVADDGPVHVCAKRRYHGGQDCRCNCGDGWPLLATPGQETDHG